MSGKSFTDQMRSRKRRMKRKRHSQHEHDQPSHRPHQEESSDIQSQDLLAGDDDEQAQQKQEHLQQEKEEDPMNVNVVQDNVNRNTSERDEAAAKVQDEVSQDRNDDISLSIPPCNPMGPPPLQEPIQREEELKILLSEALYRESAIQEQNRHYRQALAANRQQGQQVMEELKKCQQNCEMYRKKYSDIKHKFYHWYNHFLHQWAAKFRQGETRDLPPGPDTVGGLSPQSSRPTQEDGSVLSTLQPRRIFQDSEGTGSTSVTPSPFLERPTSNESVLQPERVVASNHEYQSRKENMENANLVDNHDSVIKQSPTADAEWNKTGSSAGGEPHKTKKSDATKDDESIQSNEDEDETQLEVPHKAPPAKDDESDDEVEDEAHFNYHSNEHAPGKPKPIKALLNAPANEKVKVHSDCSDIQMIFPPEDEGRVQSSDDEDTQLEFPFSHNQCKSISSSKAVVGDNQLTAKIVKLRIQSDKQDQSDANLDSRGRKFYAGEEDTRSSTSIASRPSDSARKVSLSPTPAVPSAALSSPYKSLSSTNGILHSFEKHGGRVGPDESRRASSSSTENGKRNYASDFEHENEEASQALFSQLPPTPPKADSSRANLAKSTSTASKGRASAKNASTLRAMEGWTSNVAARAFVHSTTTTNPPPKKKQRLRADQVKPNDVPSEIIAASCEKPNRSHPKAPPKNPYAPSSKSAHNMLSSTSNETPRTPKIAARMNWSDDEDEDDSPKAYKYQEVVRCRHDREQLPGHCCSECDKFANHLCNAEGGHVFDRKEFLGMSRHRSRHSPENTPPGFWELSFADEVKARAENKNDESP